MSAEGAVDFLDCWFLSGPTASGKTAVAVELARRIGAEIVSMDSMALYRGMDVGTAKPTALERRDVPHHLIDVVDPHEEFSLAQYVAAAQKCVEDIRRCGREALFVGGTPLYLKGLLRGVFDGPAADPALRAKLAEEARREGSALLHARLARVDPATAARLHPNDTRRIIRAIEVFEKTGVPISQWQRQFDRAISPENCRAFVLDWPRPALYGRIDRRVDAMFAAGLVEEVGRLLTLQRPPGKTALQAVGYRETVEHLRGERDLAATVELVKRNTRRFAKRQLTWFRSLPECRLVRVEEPFEPAEVARRIAEAPSGGTA
ncbi:MAG: tRNA (adenosine(37)-N6)-dimethylallyltransferase MiaA [Pirellulales bacterium]|nr:tRNA (adenosine(37)-N6)-dimethylallyltransferase MiaA [Pirellulales bacterium]